MSMIYEKICQKLYTRDDYMKGEVKHEQYYNQFVSRAMLDHLKATLKDKIQNSEHSSFNDIPIRIWDRMPNSLLPLRAMYKLNRGASLADKVCAYKAAARIIRDEYKRDQERQ